MIKNSVSVMLVRKIYCRLYSKIFLNWQKGYVNFLFIMFSLLLLLEYEFSMANQQLPARIQRRFMWKQMDNTVDAMKNMFSEFLPSYPSTTQTTLTGNIFDYLPSETTRVKYIIRNLPNTKPMKIIKIRSTPKKIIKIMAMPTKLKVPLQNNKFPLPNSEELRKLEKEQEAITEEKYNEQQFKPNDILNGKINEDVNDWTPVSQPLTLNVVDQQTIKPYAVDELHTSIIAEPLIQTEESHNFQLQKEKYNDSYKIPHNNYEVTEYTAEESVALPLSQEYNTNRNEFLSSYKFNSRKVITTSTTTESPNYPAEYLQFQRSQQHERKKGNSSQSHLFNGHYKHFDYRLSSNWVPLNITGTSTLPKFTKTLLNPTIFKQLPSLRTSKTIEQKWPPSEVSTQRSIHSIDSNSAHTLHENDQYSESTEAISDSVATKTYRKKPAGQVSNPSFSNLSPRYGKRGSIKFGDRIHNEDV